MNLYLIGYRGSGKSTVAQAVADRLQRDVIDTDRLIESTAAMSISQIFSQFGASDFRERESEVIESYPATANLVVALGGGAVLSESNRVWLRQHGKTVWLTCPPEILWQRIQADETTDQSRPDLTPFGGLAEIQQVLASRIPVYAESADFTIDVGSLSPTQVADQVAQWWQSVDK